MQKPLDIFALLKRGGEMTPTEEKQFLEEMQEAKLAELSNAISGRSLDQPVKVVPLQRMVPTHVGGYFTQQKWIVGKEPSAMEAVLGIFGKLSTGAMVMQFVSPLRKGDYESKAYSYLPDGNPYKHNSEEKVYLPGKGCPQWKLTRVVEAVCIGRVLPGQEYKIEPRYRYK